MQDANMFKYVLGVDVTVMTNLMVSGQFIQFRNLDYVDTSRTCTTQVGNSINCSKYTADFATLHLSNDMNKGEENKEFFSLFFSKPLVSHSSVAGTTSPSMKRAVAGGTVSMWSTLSATSW